jgi:hypothetical protein
MPGFGETESLRLHAAVWTSKLLTERETQMAPDFPDVSLFANLKDDDPALIAAIIEAKETLPQFLETATKTLFSPATYLVKVPFLDRTDTEEEGLVCTRDLASEKPLHPICHLWLSVTSVLGDLMFCSVVEAPAELRLKRGTSFVIAGDTTEDWMINHRGEVYGGFSLRVIRSRLCPEDQVKFDKHTGIRQFKNLMP